MQNLRSKQAFTLVELIVVIVILAILATISFLSFNSYSSSARDSTRLGDMTNIVKGLGIFYTTSSSLPYPDNYITINAGTGYSIYQGTVGNTVLGIIKMSQAKDNLDNTYYSYSINQARTQYSIAGYLENKPSSFNNNVIPSQAGIYSLLNSNNYSSIKFLDNTIQEVNAIDYSKRYLIIKGGNVGILTESGTNTPIEQTTTSTGIIDLLTTTKNLILNTSSTVYSNGNNAIYGSGLIIGIIQSNQNGGYTTIPPTSCPDGFIPVQGNLEFNQPGFCVAKYEMKQAVGDAGSWNGPSGTQYPLGTAITPYCLDTGICNSTGSKDVDIGAIVSKPSGYPIVYINQYNAIEACKSMGVGYHLITNNEYMTIARDIESQANNWSGAVIGTTLNRGQSSANWLDSTTGSMTAIQGEYGSPNSGFINKRTHNLSNGQIIWDFAGNVREHVNKANSIDGSNYYDGNNYKSDACSGVNNRNSFYQNDGNNACVWSNGYSYSNIGPKTQNLNANNGIGRIYSSNTVNNVFFRSGAWCDGTGVGIFAIYIFGGVSNANGFGGFRCAK